MKVNKDADKRDIAESQIYQNLKQTVKNQEMMALGTVQEIYDFYKDINPKYPEQWNPLSPIS